MVINVTLSCVVISGFIVILGKFVRKFGDF